MANKRTFEFEDGARDRVWERQKHRCALCGVELSRLIPSDNLHHVIPNQAGEGKSLPTGSAEFLASDDNGVVLCDPCHRAYAHPDGKTKNGAVPFFGHYRFSHGPRRDGRHELWLTRLREHAAVVWPKYTAHVDDFPLERGATSKVRSDLRVIKEQHWAERTGG